MYDALLTDVLEHADLNDELDTVIEDQLRRMFAIDAECPLDNDGY